MHQLNAQRWERYREMSLLRGVSFDSVERFLEEWQETSLEAGAVLLQAGAPNQFIYQVLDGALYVHLDGLDTDPEYELGVGDCAGEMSILSQVEVSAWVVAATDCRLLRIRQDLLFTMINTSHAIASNLLHLLAGRVRAGNDRLVETLESRQRYQHFASVDALTGLHNRLWLDERLPEHLRHCSDQDIPVCLLMMDADHFKLFNDAHGHLAGDNALRSLASVLRSELRPLDMAARFGGEEFMILLHQVKRDTAVEVAERLRRRIAETPVSFLGQQLKITVSCGLAESIPGQSVEHFIACADQALYQAKHNGRNQVCAAPTPPEFARLG